MKVRKIAFKINGINDHIPINGLIVNGRTVYCNISDELTAEIELHMGVRFRRNGRYVCCQQQYNFHFFSDEVTIIFESNHINTVHPVFTD